MSPTILRTGAVTRLEAAALVASGRVFDSRTNAVTPNNLPCLVCFSKGTSRSRIGVGVPTYRVSSTLGVQCWATGTTDAAAMASAETLAGNVIEALLTDSAWVSQYEYVDSVSDEPGVSDESDGIYAQVVVSVSVQWTEVYEPRATDDEIIPFTGADVTTPSEFDGLEGKWEPEQE